MITSAEIRDELARIFHSLLDDPQFIYESSTKIGDFESWDSFAQINLIIEVESRFLIEFDSEEIGALTSIHLIEEAVNSKLNQRG